MTPRDVDAMSDAEYLAFQQYMLNVLLQRKRDNDRMRRGR